MNLPHDLKSLQQRAQTDDFKYLFFWGHSEKKEQITQACLSQWYPCPFETNGESYPTAEHYMMAEKARLFKDEATRQKILTCETPAQAKKLGRAVRDFDEKTWSQNCLEIVSQGSFQKFSQNPTLAEFLLGTQNRILVETSPVDRIWGIGMAHTHPDILDPCKWRGPNLLGFALMRARQQLINP